MRSAALATSNDMRSFGNNRSPVFVQHALEQVSGKWGPISGARSRGNLRRRDGRTAADCRCLSRSGYLASSRPNGGAAGRPWKATPETACRGKSRHGQFTLKHPGFMARVDRHDADTSGVQYHLVEAAQLSVCNRAITYRLPLMHEPPPTLLMMWCFRELACPFLPGRPGSYHPGAGLDWLDSRRTDRASRSAEPPARRQRILVARDIQVFGRAIEAARGPLTSSPVSATSMLDFPARGPLWPDTLHLPFRAALRLRST